jgi:polyhydroxyalkanoate synthesis regulator phasin
MKQDINKLFNDLADEGELTRNTAGEEVDLIIKIARLKKSLNSRVNTDNQRDDLIRMIAAILGLQDDERFRDFLTKE